MNSVDKIKKGIKESWIMFFRMIIFFLIILAFAFYLFDLKESIYVKEYKSTTWYEVEATYSHSSKHQEQDSEGNYVDSYDWYYNYVGKDGNTYTYIDKNNSVDGTEGYTTTIYVDEKDPSHSLEIRSMDKSTNDWAKKLTAIIILGPYLVSFIVGIIILYVRLGIAKSKEGVI